MFHLRAWSGLCALTLIACPAPPPEGPEPIPGPMDMAADVAEPEDQGMTPEDTSPDLPPDMTPDATPDETPDAAPECSPANPGACAYVPAVTSAPDPASNRVEEISYMDVTGRMRTFRAEFRFPMVGAQAVPVVIWSHGGASGRDSPGSVGEAWGRAFNRAGYAVVAIAHRGRSDNQTTRLCDALGVTGCDQMCAMDSDCTMNPEGGCQPDVNLCRYFKPVGWDRPGDVSAVIDTLERLSAPGESLEGVVDPTRVAHAGHSAGGGASLMLSGAPRTYSVDTYALIDPRPKAFLSFSPQGIGEDGFTQASYDGSACASLASDPALCFSRPHLSVSGIGDDTSGVVAETRRDAFDTMPTGQKFLAWMTDEAARHTSFNHQADACERHATSEGLDPTVYPARCQDHVRWIENAAIAFLDASVRERPAARQYLQSQAPSILTGGVMDWERR